jgi:hypothetical protein
LGDKWDQVPKGKMVPWSKWVNVPKVNMISSQFGYNQFFGEIVLLLGICFAFGLSLLQRSIGSYYLMFAPIWRSPYTYQYPFLEKRRDFRSTP